MGKVTGPAMIASAILLTLLVSSGTGAQNPGQRKRVIIATAKPYSNLVSDLQSLGGIVMAQYQYFDAIAADVPANALPLIADLVGEDAISEDSVIDAPKPVRTEHRSIPSSQTGIYASATVGAGTRIFNSSQLPFKNVPSDAAYTLDLNHLNVQQLHSAGFTGNGITVAVIDSGVRPGYFGLDSDGSVIGGVNFVPDGPSTFYSSPTNDPHGTFVATLISGNARFLVPASSSAFISSIDANFPGALDTTTTGRYLSVIGSAPEASIYAVRIFGTDALAGAPKSRIMDAIEHVIQLRKMYDHGIAGGVNIKVCNLSFGTSTIYAGHTPLERLIDQLFANDIVPIIAGGDAGPSSLTISSPATAFSSLTVGATSPASNERLWRDLSGDYSALARPSSATQTAWFSSRGPTADGRIFPDVVVAGFGVLSQGCGGDNGTGTCIYNPNSVDVASGTSFSAPIVSGVAALLRQKFPKASTGQIWNAIVQTADNRQLGDDSTVLDQGQGVVSATNASALLESGKASNKLPPHGHPDSSVADNVEDNTKLHISYGTVKQRFKKLKPGERGEIDYLVDDNTSQVEIDLSKITPTLPPNQQNPLFGDDIFLNVQSAKTSDGAFGDYYMIDPPFNNADVVGDSTFIIPNPEPGIMRITLMGDTTNAGTISGNVMVSPSKQPLPPTLASGTIRGGDNLTFEVTITANVSIAQFQLRWTANWGRYPTNDLDMYLFDPSGNVDSDGATLNSPENAAVNNPTPGTWTILVRGSAVPTKQDTFSLSVILDGKPVTRLR